MNSLSWMIYAADLVGGLDAIGEATVFGAGVTLAGHLVVKSLRVVSIHEWRTWPDLHGDKPEPQPYVLPWRPILAVALLGALAAAVIPSSQTVLLIAGSEAAEVAVTSEAGRAMLADVQATIRDRLADLAAESQP